LSKENIILNFHHDRPLFRLTTLEGIDATPRMSWIEEDDKKKNIVQFICLGEKVGGNVLKYFKISNY